MSSLTHYVFRSVWTVDAAAHDLVPVLYDLESYPAWWPEIRTVTRLDERRFDVLARSFLPYDLRFVSEGDDLAPEARTINARLTGDMEGTVRWTVEEVDGGCRLTYDQQVSTHKRLLNVMAPLARPGFRANHALMMRHGQAGLRTYMAGFARGSGVNSDNPD